jgi:hypothetical protein
VQKQLFIGAGGTGKTHYNLVDRGLVRPCYVANSYKLISAKKLEYKCPVEVLAIAIGKGNPESVKEFKKKFNSIIVDEVSMITDEECGQLLSTYTSSKMIFCGDIGYQAEAIGGKEIDVSRFDQVVEFATNYRVNDPVFVPILIQMRDCIKSHKMFDCSVFKKVQIENVASMYTVSDICLTFTKNKRKIYDHLPGDKYLITKSTEKSNRGEIVHEIPSDKNFEKTNAFTTHSVQGETFLGNIFIDEELVNSGNLRLFYTAVSRAKKLSQIYIVVSSYVAA